MDIITKEINGKTSVLIDGICGVRTKIINLKLKTFNDKWKEAKKTSISKEFPELSYDEHIFLQTGLTDTEWNQIRKDN